MLIQQGKTNWICIIAVALISGAVGGGLLVYINDTVRSTNSLSQVQFLMNHAGNKPGSAEKKCGADRNGFARSVCNKSCNEDWDCVYSCSCGAINRNETCVSDPDVMLKCGFVQVSCQNGECVMGNVTSQGEVTYSVGEIVSNFAHWSGKDIKVYSQGLRLIKGPDDPNGNCRMTQTGCDQLWHYAISDGASELPVSSAKKLDGNKILYGKFSLKCPFITKSTQCKNIDDYCECINTVNNATEKIKADMVLLIN